MCYYFCMLLQSLEKIANFLLILLIFCFLPFWLLESAFFVIEDSQRTRAVEEIRLRHEKILSRIGVLDDTTAFPAMIVKKAFLRARNGGLERAKKDISDIQQRFNGALDIFFFSAEGKLIEPISSGKYGKSFMERCFKALKEISEDGETSRTGQTMLRQLLRMSDLLRVWEFQDGRAMPIGEKPSDGYFFYHCPGQSKESNFAGYIGLLRPEKYDANFPLRCALNIASQKNPEIQLGMADVESTTVVTYPKTLKNVPELISSLIKTHAGYNTFYAGENFVLSSVMRKTNGSIVAYEKLTEHTKRYFKLFFRLFMLLVSLKLFYSTWEKAQTNIRISTRIIRLFLYAVFLPAGMLLIGGYRAFQDHILVLQSNLEASMRSKLRQFDEGFPHELRRLEGVLKKMNQEVQNPGGHSRVAEIFEGLRSEKAVSHMLAIDSDGKSVFELNKPENNIIEQRFQVGRFIAKEIFRRLNQIDKVDGGTLVVESVKSMANDITSAGGWSMFQRNLGSFTPIGLGKDGGFMLFDAIYEGPEGKKMCKLVTCVVVLRDKAEAKFFDRLRDKLEKQPDFNWQVSLWANSNPISSILSGNSMQKEIIEIGREINIKQAPIRKIIENSDGKHLLIGELGQNLNLHSYIAHTSLAPIERKVKKLWQIIYAILTILFISTAGIGIMLSKQLIKPINDIGEGIKAVQRRDFTHVVPVSSGDELGKVSLLMNEVIHGMQDLSVARAIQENLFPPGELYASGLRIFGRSRTMSDVGGDYYDFIELDEDTVFGIVGDVSGHGVSAALIMGMAKCFFTLADRKNDSLNSILLDFNQFLLSTIKRLKMMTLVAFRWKKSTRTIEFANAGHIPPLIFHEDTGLLEELSLPCMPLGVSKKGKFKTGQLLLKPNDKILLCTDGLPEAVTKEKEQLGFEAFPEWFKELAEKEPMEVVDGMFEKLDHFIDGAPANDDITIICLKAD